MTTKVSLTQISKYLYANFLTITNAQDRREMRKGRWGRRGDEGVAPLGKMVKRMDKRNTVGFAKAAVTLAGMIILCEYCIRWCLENGQMMESEARGQAKTKSIHSKRFKNRRR